MKKNLNIISTVLMIVTVLVVAMKPGQVQAQRFNHGGGGGGGMRGGGAPAGGGFHPAPAPVPAVMSRPTINGGGRNIGNHNFTRVNDNVNTAPRTNNRPPEVRGNVNERSNVNVRANVNFHENVNVYHGNRGGRGYDYHPHPYQPHYWGPRWHPVGFFLSSLAADAYFFSLANQRYYYDDGVYYSPYNGGYSVVAAPIGAVVSSLPPGYETVMVGNDYFYYYGGSFYINNGQGYQVVAAPYGAVVTEIPDGAADQQINGQDLLVYNNTYFLPVSDNGQDAYQVVQVN